MSTFLQWVHSAFQFIDPYFGVLATFPIVLTFWEIWFGRRRRHKRILRDIRSNPGSRPAALIVDILPGKEIHAQVENYLQSSDQLKAIPEDRVFRITASAIGVTSSELTSENMIEFANKTRETAAEIYTAGTDVIHYFHSGPIPTVAIVGAALANGPLVRMYHWRQGQYEDWGPLRHPGV